MQGPQIVSGDCTCRDCDEIVAMGGTRLKRRRSRTGWVWASVLIGLLAIAWWL